MIFVAIGTQDKSFERILNVIEKAILDGVIKERVVVQAGHTKFCSENMEVFDFLPMDEFEKMFNEASVIITHGGVGSILDAIKKNKKVVAAPRYKKYKEHVNDHQLEIVEKFTSEGYILSYLDDDNFTEVLVKLESFVPRKYVDNKSEIVNYVDNYIVKEEKNSGFINHIINLFIENYSLILFSLMLLIMDFYLKFLNKENSLLSFKPVTPLLFTFSFIFLIVGISLLFKKKWRIIFLTLIFLMSFSLFVANVLNLHLFGNIIRLRELFLVGEGFIFISSIYNYLKVLDYMVMLLIIVVFILSIILQKEIKELFLKRVYGVLILLISMTLFLSGN